MNKKVNELHHVDDTKQLTYDVDMPNAEHEAEENLMLTTLDNPYNPKEEYDKWRTWDVDHGYHTEEYLARLTDIPDNVDIDDDIIIGMLTNKAINELLENDVLGIYKLI